VAAVAPRGYMLLCLLHWDARPIRGRSADGERCRASMLGLIFAMALMASSSESGRWVQQKWRAEWQVVVWLMDFDS
jgi:hypothetical protein